jgi:hypothetical protein
MQRTSVNDLCAIPCTGPCLSSVCHPHVYAPPSMSTKTIYLIRHAASQHNEDVSYASLDGTHER